MNWMSTIMKFENFNIFFVRVLQPWKIKIQENEQALEFFKNLCQELVSIIECICKIMWFPLTNYLEKSSIFFLDKAQNCKGCQYHEILKKLNQTF